MINFPVSPEKANELRDRMSELQIYESDLDEHFVKSGGPGGQKVNKTSSCVKLKHLPSGIEIRCQKDRSQALNRFFARRMLCDKIESQSHGKYSKQNKIVNKIKKQKDRAYRRSKQKKSSITSIDE